MLGLLGLLFAGAVWAKEGIENEIRDQKVIDDAKANGSQFWVDRKGRKVSFETGRHAWTRTDPKTGHWVLEDFKTGELIYDYTEEADKKRRREAEEGKYFKIKPYMNYEYSRKYMEKVYFATDNQGRPFVFTSDTMTYYQRQMVKEKVEKQGLEYGNEPHQYNGRGFRYIPVEADGVTHFPLCLRHSAEADVFVRNSEQKYWDTFYVW